MSTFPYGIQFRELWRFSSQSSCFLTFSFPAFYPFILWFWESSSPLDALLLPSQTVYCVVTSFSNLLAEHSFFLRFSQCFSGFVDLASFLFTPKISGLFWNFFHCLWFFSPVCFRLWNRLRSLLTSQPVSLITGGCMWHGRVWWSESPHRWKAQDRSHDGRATWQFLWVFPLKSSASSLGVEAWLESSGKTNRKRSWEEGCQPQYSALT